MSAEPRDACAGAADSAAEPEHADELDRAMRDMKAAIVEQLRALVALAGQHPERVEATIEQVAGAWVVAQLEMIREAGRGAVAFSKAKTVGGMQ